MVRLVEFDAVTEERVRFIEDTPRNSIIEKTMDRLEQGEEPMALVTAAALAVSRSTELPADHHGGPIHPVAGIHAVTGMLSRLPGDQALLPVLQCVALANKHIHLPSMGPAAMVQFENLNYNADKHTVLQRLATAIEGREARLSERWVTLACEKASPGEILNVLLDVAIRRNPLDDHYFLYTLYACRALDAIGWQFGPIVLRPVVRYLARHHSFEAYGEFSPGSIEDGIGFYRRFDELRDLLKKHNLNEQTVALCTDADESEAIEALAGKICAVDVISSLPETIVAAIAGGLSLYGTLEGMSIGGARLFLRSHTNNPFDVHIHTGTAARRYLLGFDEVSFEHKLMSLIGWPWSYEIRYLDHTLTWDWQPDIEAPEKQSPDELLEEMEQRILNLEGYDVTNLPVVINYLVAPQENREIVKLAERYVHAGYDVEALFTMTASLVCREDASEMHGYKLQQASLEEYRVCNPELRWVHAVAAVKQAAVNAPTRPHRFYPQIAARVAAA